MVSAPSFDEINKKLKKPLDPTDRKQKKKLECVQVIAGRFLDKHKIKILDHIKRIKKVGYAYEQGFEFHAEDNGKWIEVLYDSKKFVPDRKDNIAGCAASLVTLGQGFRELGTKKSLHCAVDIKKSSVHLDNTGFRVKVPGFGYVYTLDGLPHVVYDLFWDDKVVKNAYNLNYTLGSIMDSVQLNFLSSKNKYSSYGAEVVIFERNNLKFSAEYARKFNLGNSIKRGRSFYKEFGTATEQKFMVNLEMKFDISDLFIGIK